MNARKNFIDCANLVEDEKLWDPDSQVFKRNCRQFFVENHPDKIQNLPPKQRELRENTVKKLSNCYDLFDKDYKKFHSEILNYRKNPQKYHTRPPSPKYNSSTYGFGFGFSESPDFTIKLNEYQIIVLASIFAKNDLWDSDVKIFQKNCEDFIDKFAKAKEAKLKKNKLYAMLIKNYIKIQNNSYNEVHVLIRLYESYYSTTSPPKQKKAKSPPKQKKAKSPPRALTKQECESLYSTKINPLTNRKLSDKSKIYNSLMKSCKNEFTENRSPKKKKVSCSGKKKSDCTSPCRWEKRCKAPLK